jgi:hypothetical protein
VIADVVAADRGDGGSSGDYELVVVADVVGGLGAHQGELVEVQPANNQNLFLNSLYLDSGARNRCSRK